jgi:hypothetical protein
LLISSTPNCGCVIAQAGMPIAFADFATLSGG